MTAVVAITACVVALAYAKTSHAANHTIPDKLAKEARYVAAHGGILGSCHDCATPRMKNLVRRLIIARFTPEGPQAVRTALCVARGESGYNPGAISHTGDYGVFQINRASWYDTYDWTRILDPVYNVGVGWAMSQRGRSWGPWVVWQNGSCS